MAKRGIRGLTAAAFSRLAHVSEAAVCQAIRVHRIHRDRRGRIDPKHSVNTEFLTAQKLKKVSAGAKKKRSKAATRRKGDTAKTRAMATLFGAAVAAAAGKDEPLTIQKLRQEVRMKTHGANLREIAVAEKRKQLVPRDLVRRWYAAMGGLMRTHLLDMPARTSPHVAALVQSGKASEAQAYMEKEITDALRRILEGADATAREYFESITASG